MASYNHEEIEKKWQKKWENDGLCRTEDKVEGKENFYTLVEFPYPSGNLHTGHWYAFSVPDIFARYKRMNGFNVLFPIGFDSFGLPAENAAIKNNIDPKKWTYQNIDTMTTQLKSMGAMFDWDRMVITSDEDYYKWTQWLFLQLYKKGLAYQGEAVVNWDPVDKTVLANEQVLPDGTAERSGAVVEKKKMTQWFFKITDYADRLIEDLDELKWPEQIKQAQREWIGKKEGAEISFQVLASSFQGEIKVFTTRPDTLFGATYMILAPEHELVEKLKDSIENWDEVLQYTGVSAKKSDLDRQKDGKEKTGVELRGVKAINPANNEEIPIFIADYVLGGYGTGAIMAVPAHDERDFAFAQKFDLPIKQVIQQDAPGKIGAVGTFIKNKKGEYLFQRRDKNAPSSPGKLSLFGGGLEDGETLIECLRRELKEELELDITTHAHSIRFLTYIESNSVPRKYVAIYLVEGVDDSKLVLHEGESIEKYKTLDEIAIDDRTSIIQKIKDKDLLSVYDNVGFLINSGEFNNFISEEAKEKITKKVGGVMKSTYRLRDWLISRQRYWGCPIPIVYDPEGKAYEIPEEHLPWTLPTDVDFKPTGVAPLARSKELKERVEKIFGKGWTPEVDTMDVFVDSSWYFLRYTDTKNEKEFASKSSLKNWMPVQRYSGGAEHTTVHVLYSRFFQKALHDLGLVEDEEPYRERYNRGLILGTDGRKMSKRWGNIIDPDEHVKNVGADAVRLYLGFIGPYNIPGNYPWDIGGLVGVRRFLEKVVYASEKVTDHTDEHILPELNRAIKKVGEDIELFKFNTAISQLMILLNTIGNDNFSKVDMEKVLKMIAPFAPHITEELWEKMGYTTSIHLEAWPQFDESKLVSDTMSIVVQVNGKTRGEVEASSGSEEREIMTMVAANEKLSKWTEGEIKKVIYVENKLINIVL